MLICLLVLPALAPVIAQDWTPFRELVGATTMPGDGFGSAVSLYQDRVLVGASGDTLGHAYLFDRNEGGVDQWGNYQVISIPQDYANDRGFGRFVHLDEDGAFIASNEHVFHYPFDPSLMEYTFGRVVHTGGGDLVKSASYFVAGQCVGGFGNYDSAFRIYAQNAGGSGAWGFQQLLFGATYDPICYGTTGPETPCSMALTDQRFTYGSPVRISFPQEGCSCAQGEVRSYVRDANTGSLPNTWESFNSGSGSRPFGKAVAQQGDSLFASFTPGCPWSMGGGISCNIPSLGWFHIAGIIPDQLLSSRPYLFARDADEVYIFKEFGSFLAPNQLIAGANYLSMDVEGGLCALGTSANAVTLLGTWDYVGMQEDRAQPRLAVSPNPAAEEAHIRWAQIPTGSGYRLDLMDTSGRLLRSQPVLSSSMVVPRLGLASGLTIARLLGANGELIALGQVVWQ